MVTVYWEKRLKRELWSAKTKILNIISDKNCIIKNDDISLTEFSYSLHSSNIVAVDISYNKAFCASLGSNDDGNLIVMNMKTKKVFARKQAQNVSSGCAKMMKFANTKNVIVTAGIRTFRIWEINQQDNRLEYREMNQNKVIGDLTGLEFSEDDCIIYVSNKRGEIIIIDSVNICLMNIIKKVSGEPIGQITCLKVFGNILENQLETIDKCLISDMVCLCDIDGQISNLKISRRQNIINEQKLMTRSKSPRGYVKSICKIKGNEAVFITNKGFMVQMDLEDSSSSKYRIIHQSMIHAITQIGFVENLDELFFVSGGSRICIFQSSPMILRTEIEIKSLECLSCLIFDEGSLVLSGWSDGSIRSFGPESGDLKFELANAHRGKVTALAIDKRASLILSGGSDGQLRLWKANSLDMHRGCPPPLHNCINAHRSSIISIEINETDNKCLTASSDGSCTLWDINTLVAIQVLFINSAFTCALREPYTQSQILSSSCDEIIRFWNANKGTLIREIRNTTIPSTKNQDTKDMTAISSYQSAPKSSNIFCRINSLQFVNDHESYERLKMCDTNDSIIDEIFSKQCFILGGAGDRKLKVLSYENAECLAESSTHGDDITRIACSQDGKSFLSGTRDGSIYLWRLKNKAITSHNDN